MEEIEQDLKNGNPVHCAHCWETIMPDESYVMHGKYMYCDEFCLPDEDDEDTGPSKSSMGLMLPKLGQEE